MKIVGLIVEYNPFHNGHSHHIEESLRVTGADKAIVVMSGDFVQRGAPAIMPKHLRAQMALQSGASLVIELPVRYATGSAEFFAMGAVSLLHQLGCVDCICFGSESGDLDSLTVLADLFIQEPPQYKHALQESLRLGLTFPQARQNAVARYFQDCTESSEIPELLAQPNNILGIEYIKALKRLQSNMRPYTITRKTSHYHDVDLQENYSSASAIRAQIHLADSTPRSTPDDNEQFLPTLTTQLPPWCHQIMNNSFHKRYPIYMDDFSLLLHHKLLLETPATLLQYQDVTEELANRIINQRNSFITTTQFIDLIQTKNTTHARISRVLLNILLNTQKHSLDFDNTSNDTCVTNAYIRVLGFQKRDSEILTRIKISSLLPLVTKLANMPPLSNLGHTILTEDLYASNLYETIVTNKFHTSFIHEFEKSLILI